MSEFTLVSELAEKMNWIFEPLGNIVLLPPGMLAWRLRNAPPRPRIVSAFLEKYREVTA